MKIARIRVHGPCISVEQLCEITSGMVGATVSFEVDGRWTNLSITAVFRAGDVTRDVLNPELSEVEIPWEVLAEPRIDLYCGLYGVDGNGVLVIPTTMARVGRIDTGTDPTGDPGTAPTLPIWAQLDQRVTDLEKNGTGGGSIIIDGDVEDVIKAAQDAADTATAAADDATDAAKKAAESAADAKESADSAKESADIASRAADEVAECKEAAASSATEARETAENVEQYVEEAKKAAEEARECAEAAKALERLEDLTDLKESIQQAELFAKASQSYATDSQDAAAAAEESSRNAEDAALRAEEAAAQSAANVDEAVAEVNAAKDAAVADIEGLGAETVQASEDAKTAAAEAQASEEAAATSASEAAESEDNAALYAEAAKQVAEKNGYFYFEIVDGRLIETRTDNVSEDLNFTISEEGRLILEYAE